MIGGMSNGNGNEPFKPLMAVRLDSVTRSLTAAAIAIALVGATIYLALVGHVGDRLSGLQAVIVGWTGVIVGFYFGGHVAQNTSAQEEARQHAATTDSEASAVRSEASALRSEKGETPYHEPTKGT
jgi:hypothetical protein